MTMAVYSIGLLPVQGTHDFSLPLRSYLGVLRESLRILDGIRTGPVQLTLNIEMELDSTRYHLATMFAMVDTALRKHAADHGVTAQEVPNLGSALDRYLSSLLRTKGLWNAWLDGNPLAFGGFGADGTAVPSNAEPAPAEATSEYLKAGEAAQSKTIPESLVFLGVGLAVAGLIYVVRS